MALTIGVDVGGTTVAAGVVDEQGSVLATAQHDTPSDDPKRTEDVIADEVRELMACMTSRRSALGRPASWTLSGPPCSSRINIVPDGRRCGCGLEGCWEQYASGRALVQEAQEVAEASPAMARDLLRLAGDEPEMITGPMVTQAAQEGDVAALRCFDVVGTWLGRGMAQLAAVLDPGLFVLGGGVSAAGELLRGPAWQALLQYLTARRHRPHAELRVAKLGPEAGIVGAGDLARDR